MKTERYFSRPRLKVNIDKFLQSNASTTSCPLTAKPSQLTMVNLKSAQESNAALRSTLSSQTALFVGATSGLGLTTLNEYTRHSNRPKVYIVGRSDTRLSSIIGDLERINPQGSYVPIKSEISLFKNVDTACKEYKRKEKSLDLLIMSPGYLKLARQGTPPSLFSSWPRSFKK